MTFLELLFLPLQPFVGHPERAAIIAFLFLLGFAVLFYRGAVGWPLLVPASAWGLFAVWELYCMRQGYNIRVDLLLIAPLLLVLTLASIGTVFVARPNKTNQ